MVLDSNCTEADISFFSHGDDLMLYIFYQYLQYEAAWRAGNWDFSLLVHGGSSSSGQNVKSDRFNENLYR